MEFFYHIPLCIILWWEVLCILLLSYLILLMQCKLLVNLLSCIFQSVGLLQVWKQSTMGMGFNSPTLLSYWAALVPQNFKPSSLIAFDGKSHPQEHINAINTKMEIIGVFESFKCKLISSKFKEASLMWYINIPLFLVTNYQDLSRNMILKFSSRKHRRVSTTSLFNVYQGHFESMREYLVRFNEVTIKVVHPYQEMFVGGFQNVLISGNFNEYLAPKFVTSMVEFMA